MLIINDVNFHYQEIVKPNGELYGIEILSRNIQIDEKTDLYVFYKALEELENKNFFELANKLGIKIHFNIYPSTIAYVKWDLIPQKIKKPIVLEILETNIHNHLDKIKELSEKGFQVALDDFGTGSANFQCLIKPFSIVKLDGLYIRNIPKVVQFLKQVYKIGEVIIEKRKCKCKLADAFQSYEFHRPEPIINFLQRIERREIIPTSV